MKSRTIAEAAKLLSVGEHRLYYGLKVGRLTASWDERLQRYFFNAKDIQRAKTTLKKKTP